jgi:hypothetical protein
MTPWITQPIPFNIGQGAAASGDVPISYENVEWNTSAGSPSSWTDSPPSTYRTGTSNSDWGGTNRSSTQRPDPSGTLNQLKCSYTPAASRWAAIGLIQSTTTNGSPDTWDGYTIYFLPAASGIRVYDPDGAFTAITDSYTSSSEFILEISSTKAEVWLDDTSGTPIYSDTRSLSGSWYVTAGAYTTGTISTITGYLASV